MKNGYTIQIIRSRPTGLFSYWTDIAPWVGRLLEVTTDGGRHNGVCLLRQKTRRVRHCGPRAARPCAVVGAAVTGRRSPVFSRRPRQGRQGNLGDPHRGIHEIQDHVSSERVTCLELRLVFMLELPQFPFLSDLLRFWSRLLLPPARPATAGPAGRPIARSGALGFRV